MNCEACGEPIDGRLSQKYCDVVCYRSVPPQKLVDPSEAEIRQRCAEIQAEWTDEQRISRMRVDWRPQPTRFRTHMINGIASDGS